jgi:hypothetical protein
MPAEVIRYLAQGTQRAQSHRLCRGNRSVCLCQVPFIAHRARRGRRVTPTASLHGAEGAVQSHTVRNCTLPTSSVTLHTSDFMHPTSYHASYVISCFLRHIMLPTSYHASYVVKASLPDAEGATGCVFTPSLFATQPPWRSLGLNRFVGRSQVIVAHGSNQRYSRSPRRPAYCLRCGCRGC